ncbi:hypothetical protein UlMin_040369 [Ulmus minor]
MGILPCPPLSCQKDTKSNQSQSTHLRSDSSASSSLSLSSQPSLPSIPSLTPPSQIQTPSTHHLCLATINSPNSSYLSSISLSGKSLYGGSSTGQILIWTRNPSQILSNPTPNLETDTKSAIKSLVVFENKLFTAHQDHKIRVWKSDNNGGYNFTTTLPTLNDRFSKLFSTKNYIEVRRHKKCTWVHHVDAVSALAISKDGSLLYSASWDRTFKVWRTSDYKCLESISNAHEDAINAIELSSDGYVYTGSADKKIKVWKKMEGDKKHTLLATMEKHKSSVNALALSSDGSVLYSGACDRSILVWQRDGGGMVVVGALRGHKKAILCLAVVEDLVFSGSADCSIRVWKRTVDGSYVCLAVLEGHKRPVKCLAVGVDSNWERNDGCDDSGSNSYHVYSGSLDSEIRVWQIRVPSFL